MQEIIQNRKKSNLLIQTATNNAIKCSSGKAEGLSHKITKFWLANYCWENNLSFATEVVFKNNQRADFVIKDWFLAIEILSTETFNKFINKSYKIPTIPIRADVSPEYIKEMLEDLSATNGTAWDFYLKKHLEAHHEKRGINNTNKG